VDSGQIQREIPPPIPRSQQDVRRASAISSDIHLAVMRDSGLSKDLAEERMSAPKSDFLNDTEWSPKMSTGHPHRGHGLPAQSASSRGTPRCHFVE